MTGITRRTFTSEFKLKAAQLVVDQNYSIREAASAMNVGKSNMDQWIRQLKNELQGTSNHPTAITADQRRIKELEKTIKRIEMEKEILKKATALLMSDSMNNFR
jgi:transposase|tara:strand:- start:1974 stop:2285 length:312 start_codon:yes stop_codon:yes gene_type:complete